MFSRVSNIHNTLRIETITVTLKYKSAFYKLSSAFSILKSNYYSVSYLGLLQSMKKKPGITLLQLLWSSIHFSEHYFQ